jgi:hypothetical protein
MPDKKKKYDVAERFKEVARRAQETPVINTGRPTGFGQMSNKELDTVKKASAQLNTKPKGDVNLPIETASPEVRERMKKRYASK